MKKHTSKSQARPGSFLYLGLAVAFLFGVIVVTALKSYQATPYLSLNQAEASAINAAGDYREIFESGTKATRQLRSAISADIEALREAKGEDVKILFGQPDLVLHDSPTTIWQYRGERCALNVYFLQYEGDLMAAPVAHYDLQPRHGNGPAPNCARDIMRVKSGTGFMSVSSGERSSSASRSYND